MTNEIANLSDVINKNKQLQNYPQTNDYAHIEMEVKSNKLEPSMYASIVIPFYKGRTYLKRTLHSLKGQSYPPDLYEVIIVQDVGGDNIDDLVSEFENDFRLRLKKIPHIGFTPARSRNVGIKNASSASEVIISLDFDIICPSRFIEVHMKWYHVSKNIAVFGLRKFIDASGIKPEDIAKKMKDIEKLPPIKSISNSITGSLIDKRLPEIKIIKKHPFPCNCFHGCNISYLKQDALDVGLYDEEFNFNFGYEDIEFGYRLWKKGLYLVFEPKALALHQENNAVTYLERVRGREINRIKLNNKVPGIAKFRESLNKGKSD